MSHGNKTKDTPSRKIESSNQILNMLKKSFLLSSNKSKYLKTEFGVANDKFHNPTVLIDKKIEKEKEIVENTLCAKSENGKARI